MKAVQSVINNFQTFRTNGVVNHERMPKKVF